MTEEKFKVFEAILGNGERVELRAPAGKLTERYAAIYAPHWCRVQKGITGARITSVRGLR